MVDLMNRRVLSLCSRNNREMLRKALASGNYKVSFVSALSEVTPALADFKPNIFIHDWGAVDQSQSRLFHLKFGKTLQSVEMIRVLIVPEVTPNMLAFASDALIEKVVSYSSATLNISQQIDMLATAQESNELSRFLRESKTDGHRYSQQEVDNKIDELFQKFPHDNKVKLEFGNLSFRQAKFSESLNLASDLLSKEPTNLRAMNLKARSLMKQGHFDKAMETMQDAHVLSPANPERLIMMGDALYGKGDLDKAISCYQEAVKVDPDSSSQAQKQIGQVRLEQGHFEEALELFRSSVSEEEAAGFFNNAAVKAVRDQKLVEALKLYETALKAVKTDKLKPLIYFNIALSLRRLGRDAEAGKYLKRCLHYNPQFDKAKVQLDQILKKSV